MSKKPIIRLPPALPDDLTARECYGAGSQLYDWTAILDGKHREYVRGKHFLCAAVTFRMMAYEQATQRKLKIHTRMGKDGKSVKVQAYKPGAV